MSEMDAYRALYVAESREYHEQIVKNLLILEKGSDEGAIDQIFRAAHSLKGMSASMGYDQMQRLCHAMEDVFHQIRGGSLETTATIMNDLLSASDDIERLLDDIEQGGAGTLEDLGARTERLEAWVGKKETAQDLQPAQVKTGDSAASATDTSPSGLPEYRISIRLSDTCDNRNLRAMIALQNLEELGQIISVNPSREVVEDGVFDGSFELALASDSDLGALKNAISGPDFSQYDVVPLNIQETKQETGAGRDEAGEARRLSGAADGGQREDKHDKVREIKNIRVDIARLDQMMNLVEDLVINRGRLTQIAHKHQIRELDETLNMVGRSVSDLQNLMMNIRMIPLNQIFNRFPRTVRDLAMKIGKEVDFTIEGGDTELDRSVLDGLNDPLLHLIRNAIDHGIESPEVRESEGKARTGTLKLSARRDRDNVLIIIEDDGAGINLEKVRKKAVERGLISWETAESYSPEQVYDLLFQPGFSTAEKITDVSGRGVGLDVVKTSIESLKGTIKVDSAEGEGTRFELVLPPTMAIVMVMMVRVNGRRCAIPIANVAEVASLTAQSIHKVGRNEAILLREEIIPLHRLDDMFGRSEQGEILVIIQHRHMKGAIIADLIEGQQEVVIKPLSRFIGSCRGVSGVTIPGDGEAVVVIDVASIVKEQGQVTGKSEAISRMRTKVRKTTMQLSANQRDALREMGNIGAAHAATTLSTMLMTPIEINVPEIHIVDISQVHEYLGDEIAALVLFQIQGEVTPGGYIVLHIPKDSVQRLTNLMLGMTEENREFSEMDESAILEIGNIMVSAFLDATATLLNIIMLPSPPQLILDMPHAAMESILASQETSDLNDVVLFRTELMSPQHRISGNIFMLPYPPMLIDLVRMLEALLGGQPQ